MVGLALLTAACAGPPPRPDTLFQDARAVAVTPNGTLWVVDVDAVLAVRDGRVVQRIGGVGTGADAFLDPVDVDPTNGQTIYVADRAAGAILHFTAEGRRVRAIRVPDVDPAAVLRAGPQPARLGVPVAVAAGAGGVLYVADASRGHVLELDAEGAVVRVLGAGLLVEPVDLALDDDGTLWVADAGRSRIQAFDPFGGTGQAIEASFLGRLRSLSQSEGRLLVVGAEAWSMIDRDPLLHTVRGPRSDVVGAVYVGRAPVLLTATDVATWGGSEVD